MALERKTCVPGSETIRIFRKSRCDKDVRGTEDIPAFSVVLPDVLKDYGVASGIKRDNVKSEGLSHAFWRDGTGNKPTADRLILLDIFHLTNWGHQRYCNESLCVYKLHPS